MENLPSTIYEDDDVALLWHPLDSAGVALVTFTPLMSAPASPLTGFAQSVAHKLQASGIYFVSKWNHWWQVPGLDRCLELAQDLARPFPRIVTYGSSMGGYGALAFSRRLGAHAVLAMSPQYSIDATKVPFETRWRSHAARLDFARDDLNAGLSPGADVILVYDPMNDDAKQAALVAAPGARHIRVPFVGHGTPRYLQDAGLLKKVVQAALSGDLAAIPPLPLRPRRAQSYYWKALADRAFARRRLALATRLIAEAHRLAPKSYGIARQLARYRELGGDATGATEAFIYALGLRPGDATATHLVLKSLPAAVKQRCGDGDFTRARALRDEAARLAAGDDLLRRLDGMIERSEARARGLAQRALPALNRLLGRRPAAAGAPPDEAGPIAGPPIKGTL